MKQIITVVQDDGTVENIESEEVIETHEMPDWDTYSRSRKIEYSKLNQDEMRFDDLINDTTTWVDSIKAIKAKYPKGND
tara:strand:+ start:972 stop:1208 length:237 start_codon:yes stop_codon:yes gene_type:complete